MRLLLAAGLLAWTLAVGYGLTVLWNYENAPGVAARAPADWPRDSRLPAPAGRPALVLVMHPQCSCSQATVAELARLRARVGDGLDTYVLMFAPSTAAADWVRSSLWRRAEAVDGVVVTADPDGAEARRFGAVTSGQALLYDRAGRLRFSGGITGSRGHEGDNAGRSAIETVLTEERAEHASSFVFGCSIL